MLTTEIDSHFQSQSLVPEDHCCAHFVPKTTTNPPQICQIWRTHISYLRSTGSLWSSLVTPPIVWHALVWLSASLFFDSSVQDGVTERLLRLMIINGIIYNCQRWCTNTTSEMRPFNPFCHRSWLVLEIGRWIQPIDIDVSEAGKGEGRAAKGPSSG